MTTNFLNFMKLKLNIFFSFERQVSKYGESKKNNKAVSLIMITALFIIGTISCVVFIKGQSSQLNILYRLGRSTTALFIDTIKQITLLIGLPGFCGGVLPILSLEFVYSKGIFYFPDIIKTFLLFFITVFLLFLLISSIFIYHYIKKGDWESVT